MAATPASGITVLKASEVYIGAGNTVSYYEGATPVTRSVVSSSPQEVTSVEVVYYLNPYNGQKAPYPMTVRDGERSLRCFEFIDKVDIFAVNDQPVVIQ